MRGAWGTIYGELTVDCKVREQTDKCGHAHAMKYGYSLTRYFSHDPVELNVQEMNDA